MNTISNFETSSEQNNNINELKENNNDVLKNIVKIYERFGNTKENRLINQIKDRVDYLVKCYRDETNKCKSLKLKLKKIDESLNKLNDENNKRQEALLNMIERKL